MKVLGQIIDGKLVAKNVLEGLKKEIEDLKIKGIIPSLTVILVGDNPASMKYVGSKEKTCAELGITGTVRKLPKDISQGALIKTIKGLNADKSVNGILVQLPLPKGLDEKEVMNIISQLKDVDGFSPNSLGRLVLDEIGFMPCTPFGVMKMLEAYNIEPSGKNVVVIGRSIIVGKPLAMLFLRKDATVTICHSKTQGLKDICIKADIVCSAIGKAKFVTADMIKEGAVVIDIGINVTQEGKLVGDVDFESVKEKASYITPVPGGVGPMTIAMLMFNTVLAAKQQNIIL